MKYKLIWSMVGTDDLAQKVEEHFKTERGAWRLHGGPVVVWDNSIDKLVVMQAVIKEV